MQSQTHQVTGARQAEKPLSQAPVGREGAVSRRDRMRCHYYVNKDFSTYQQKKKKTQLYMEKKLKTDYKISLVEKLN